MDDGWKKWFWRSAGLGVGLAATLCVLCGGWLWYLSKPKPPKPWNSKAIRAEYDYVTTEEDENNDIAFYYTLVNDTDFDYRVNDSGDVELTVKLARENSISLPAKGKEAGIVCQFPVFVPAHGRARFGIHIGYPYTEKYNHDASEDEHYDYQTRLAKYISTELANIDGFAMFDSTNRYELVFRNGWKERAKQPLRVKHSEYEILPPQPKK